MKATRTKLSTMTRKSKKMWDKMLKEPVTANEKKLGTILVDILNKIKKEK